MKIVILFVLFAVCLADETDKTATIEQYESELNPDGTYMWAFETSNGIRAQEEGIGGQIAKGESSWTAPDGTSVNFSYTADENGYQATGPFVPEIPPLIRKALLYLRNHPPAV